jgi:hypothetical protein
MISKMSKIRNFQDKEKPKHQRMILFSIAECFVMPDGSCVSNCYKLLIILKINIL